MLRSGALPCHIYGVRIRTESDISHRLLTVDECSYRGNSMTRIYLHCNIVVFYIHCFSTLTHAKPRRFFGHAHQVQYRALPPRRNQRLACALENRCFPWKLSSY